MFMSRSSLWRRLPGLAWVGVALAISFSCHSSPETETELNSKRLLLTLRGNSGSAICVAYSPDGRWIATCHSEQPGQTESNDPHVPPSAHPDSYFNPLREVKIWDTATGEERVSVRTGKLVRAIAFFPGGKRLAGAVGRVVKIWDVTTGNEVMVLEGHSNVVRDVDIRRDGRWLVSGSSDGTVKAWDTVNGVCLHTLRPQPQGVLHVSLSPDGKRVAGTGGGGDHNSEIQIWDWMTEKQVLTLTPGCATGKALFSPGGERLASFRLGPSKYTTPGLVQVWRASTGELLFACKAHSEEVSCMAYSSDGKRLASGSEDGTVIVWDAISGEQVLGLAAHSGGGGFHEVSSVTFSPDGKRLATASWDGTVKIWDVTDARGDS
jgi:WD40 repeat protein